MKKLILNVLFIMLFLPAMSQEWVYINRNVTDIASDTCHAAFTFIPDSLNNPPYTFQFIDQSSGNIAAWYWNFGDGGTSVMQSPLHSFAQSGTYNVCLNITGADSSCYDFTCVTVVIEGPAVCEAQFAYSPEPPGSPDSFRFIDLSTGNINSWLWSFGDGTGSVEQNPLHVYPGPGTYTACLTITANDCSDIFCQDVIISDTVYHQLYGQVFAGNFPLQTGTVMLFAANPNGSYTLIGDGFPVDSNGVYYFTLVPDGIYLIQAIPIDSVGYLPTYFGDVINWQEATQVVLGIPDNPYNINLVPAGLMTPGPGSLSGQVNITGLRTTLVDKINMLLMNDNGQVIGFSKVSSSGIFGFPAMDFGTYYLRAELAGVSCDNLKIEITVDNPHANVVLNFSGNSILGAGDMNPLKHAVSVYPNPVEDRLNISLNLPGPAKVIIEIHALTGQVARRVEETVNTGQKKLSVSLCDFPAGIYTLRIFSDNGFNFLRKIIKTE